MWYNRYDTQPYVYNSLLTSSSSSVKRRCCLDQPHLATQTLSHQHTHPSFVLLTMSPANVSVDKADDHPIAVSFCHPTLAGYTMAAATWSRMFTCC